MGMCRSMHGAVPFLWSAPPHSGQHGVSGAIVPLNVRMSTSRYLGSAFVLSPVNIMDSGIPD